MGSAHKNVRRFILKESKMRRFLPLAGLGLALLIASCSDQTAVEPTTRPQYSAVANTFDKLARYQDAPLQITFGLAWRIIGPSGGSLSLAGFEMIVPPGAVSFPTIFTIYLPL